MILVLFTVPFYHFLFLKYLVLAERHFSSDSLVPFPDLCNLYTRIKVGSNLKVIFFDYRTVLELAHVQIPQQVT